MSCAPARNATPPPRSTALDAVAAQVAADAKAATGRDAIRLQALSDTLKGRTARLR